MLENKISYPSFCFDAQTDSMWQLALNKRGFQGSGIFHPLTTIVSEMKSGDLNELMLDMNMFCSFTCVPHTKSYMMVMGFLKNGKRKERIVYMQKMLLEYSSIVLLV